MLLTVVKPSFLGKQVNASLSISWGKNKCGSQHVNSDFQLNNMSLAVGYPERLLDPTVIDSYYDSYTIFIKDFFKNLQVIVDQKHNNSLLSYAIAN